MLPDQHPPIQVQKTGIVFVNLGSPDAPTRKAVRRYLKEFLSDARVIELPKWKWWPILNLIILNLRPQKVAKLYQSIWLKTVNKAPLIHYTEQQAFKTAQQLNNPDYIVTVAMRYGNPSLPSVLNQLKEQNCTRIVVLPLYPQYASATTGTIIESVQTIINQWRVVPQLQCIPYYLEHPLFIEAIVKTIQAKIQSTDALPDCFLFSYHSIPLRYWNNGDYYPCLCYKTTRLITERLKELNIHLNIQTVFQSKFGREPWVEPFLDATLEQLAKDKVKKVWVIAPGFASDCLETLEEIDEQNRELFLHNGGEVFEYIPCLNDSDDAIKLYSQLIKAYVSDLSLGS